MADPRRNFRKVPTRIRAKLASCKNDVVVSVVKTIKTNEVASLSHLGLSLGKSGLVFVPEIVPAAVRGKCSKENVEGKDVKRFDLPKVWKTFSNETPNFGDYSRGTHTTYQRREVYQVEYRPPKNLSISVSILDNGSAEWTVKFAVNRVLGRKTKGFEEDLLFDVNLLYESVGSVDVYDSDTSHADFLKTIHIDWQILPPGTVDDVVARMLSGKRKLNDEKVDVMKDRVATLASLKPIAFVAGSDEFLRYFGAQFADDCVVFENVNYGNAIYVMYSDWEKLSKRSRLDLLAGTSSNFDRVIHRKGWKSELKDIINDFRRNNP